jgi:hypothetical protein
MSIESRVDKLEAAGNDSGRASCGQSYRLITSYTGWRNNASAFAAPLFFSPVEETEPVANK